MKVYAPSAIRLETDLYDRVAALARTESRSTTSQVAALLGEALAAREAAEIERITDQLLRDPNFTA